MLLFSFFLTYGLPCKGNLQVRSVGGTWLPPPFSWGGRENVESGKADVPYLSFEQAHEASNGMEPAGINVDSTSHRYHIRVPPQENRAWSRSTTAACYRVRRNVLNTHVRGWVLFGIRFSFCLLPQVRGGGAYDGRTKLLLLLTVLLVRLLGVRGIDAGGAAGGAGAARDGDGEGGGVGHGKKG